MRLQEVYYVGTSGLKATEIDGLDGLTKLEVRGPSLLHWLTKPRH